jgi:hypothetical protein
MMKKLITLASLAALVVFALSLGAPRAEATHANGIVPNTLLYWNPVGNFKLANSSDCNWDGSMGDYPVPCGYMRNRVNGSYRYYFYSMDCSDMVSAYTRVESRTGHHIGTIRSLPVAVLAYLYNLHC